MAKVTDRAVKAEELVAAVNEEAEAREVIAGVKKSVAAKQQDR
jgi:hypothetical protein